MNGEGSQFEGERVQWDQAVELSRPGLGRAGQNKPTFLNEGDSLEVPLNISSLDDVAFFGIRATSVNGGGFIKGVSGNPTTEEPEDAIDDEPDDGTPIPGGAVTAKFYLNIEGFGDAETNLFLRVNIPEDNDDITLEDALDAVLHEVEARGLQLN